MVPDGVCAPRPQSLSITVAVRCSRNWRLTDNDTHPRTVARLDHVSELVAVAVLGRELVRDGLVVGPPGVALDMLLGRVHCGAISARRRLVSL